MLNTKFLLFFLFAVNTNISEKSGIFTTEFALGHDNHPIVFATLENTSLVTSVVFPLGGGAAPAARTAAR